MKTLDQWLDEYAASHQNPTNKLFHWICVPPIVFSIWCALAVIPIGTVTFNPATLVIAFMVLYYLRLSVPLGLGMALVSIPLYFAILALHAALGIHLLTFAAVLFVSAWIGQFIGHHIEGAKPSFLKDVQFLMIGPIWLLAALYRRFGWRVDDRVSGRA